MTDEKSKAEPQKEEEAYDSYDSLIGRFMWAMVGPSLWLGVFIPIAKGPWLSIWDVAYLGIIASMAWGRYIEQKSGKGTSLYGEPTTWRDFRRYTALLLLISAACWVAVKLLGRHLNGW